MRTALVGVIFSCWILTASAQGVLQVVDAPVDQPLNDSLRVVQMIEQAQKVQQAGDIQRAALLFHQAFSATDSLHNPYLSYKIAATFSNHLLERERADSALLVLQRSLEKVREPKHLNRLYDLMGTAHRFKGNFQEALNSYDHALSLLDSTKYPRRHIVTKQNMAVVYESTGNPGRALKNYLQGIKYAEVARDSMFLSTVLNNMGELYNQIEEPENATYYLERSLDISERIHYRTGSFRAISNLANTKSQLQDFEGALGLYQEALELHKEVRFNSPPFRILHNLGLLYLSMENYDQAEEHFRESLQYSEDLGIPQGQFYNNQGLANVAEQRNQLRRAIAYHHKALEVANHLGLAIQQQRTLEKLYGLNKKIGDISQALFYHEKFKSTSDSLRELEADQRLAKTETMLDLRKQEEVNKLLQEKHQVQEARISTQNWLIGSGILILLLVLSMLGLLFRSKRDKQQINEELEVQRNQLQQMNKVKDKILAIIAHDLRSPMSAMQGMLYLLREDELSREEIRTMSVQMDLSLSQNISMMDNLLIWAKEQMSGLAVNIQNVPGWEVVEEILGNYEFKARQKGVTLVNNVPEGLQVQADFNLLKLILRNLISNSIKYTREGDVITVSTREAGGKVSFEVNDTGIGIPEEDQRELFTLYGRSRQGTLSEKGNGLGLHLCKEFVEKQDGEISVASKEGEGTTFSFTLPYAS